METREGAAEGAREAEAGGREDSGEADAKEAAVVAGTLVVAVEVSNLLLEKNA